MTEAVLIAGLSLPLFWAAGEFGLPWLSAGAACVVCVAFVVASARHEMRAAVASPAASGLPADDGSTPAISAALNATFIGAAFLWGAGALISGYGLTELYWQHWWQYAAAMILLAAVALAYASVLPRPGNAWAGPTWISRMTRLTLAQGVAAVVGLAFLIGSGKLAADKPDWLANHVFLFGGIAVGALSAIAVKAQWRHLRTGSTDASFDALRDD